MLTICAHDIMTESVEVVAVDAPLREVASILAAGRISGAPVVDATGNVVGVVSGSDIVDAIARAASLQPGPFDGLYVVHEAEQAAMESALNRPVGEVMSTELVAADEEASISDLIDLILEHHVNRVPILHGRKPVGIVTTEDVLRAMGGLQLKGARSRSRTRG
ncbi:MAG: CBS domain-containing protein [Chthonomonadales bacterium]|nr:CBS domain-containing protein [Chthonomonadales bacterium]